MRRRHRKLTVDETLEFLLERNIIVEKSSGNGYIYEYHENTFRFWSKNESVCVLSKYLGYGCKSHGARRMIDQCTEEYCIEWPKVWRHWEEEIGTKLDLMSETSGVDLDGIAHKTYHQMSSYFNKLRKRLSDEAEFKEAFQKYVLRKIKLKKDLRLRECLTLLKPQDIAENQS